jgi:hypothetical protein
MKLRVDHHQQNKEILIKSTVNEGGIVIGNEEYKPEISMDYNTETTIRWHRTKTRNILLCNKNQ